MFNENVWISTFSQQNQLNDDFDFRETSDHLNV